MPNRSMFRRIIEQVENALPGLVLIILLVITLTSFWVMPYYGFFIESNGRVGSVYAPGVMIQTGDQILQVGEVRWDDFRTNLRLPLFTETRPGFPTSIRVQRAGVELTFDYTLPGATAPEIRQRVFNIWFVPFGFWAVGMLIFLFARPRDTTWRLLLLFNFLTAIWIALGTLSSHRLWDAAVWLRIFIWLSVPIYLHLHFVFPKSLTTLPTSGWVVLYSVAVAAACLQWLQLLPTNFYQIALLLSLIISVLFLLLQYWFRPQSRPATGYVFKAVALVFGPMIVLNVFALLTGFNSVAGGSLLLLPFLPIAYFYGIYRHHLGDHEWRVNRTIAIYAYLVGLAILMLTLASALGLFISETGGWLAVVLGVTLVVTLTTLWGYRRFEQWVEERFLKIKSPSPALLEGFVAQLTTLDQNQLITYLRDHVSAGLLIQQSALVMIADTTLQPLYLSGLTSPDLPLEAAPLTASGDRYISDSSPDLPKWLRLCLPLAIERRPIGFWLLGRRDPDDYYSAQDITALRAIANQTAIGLHNILQSQRIQILYQNDITQHEAERASLARELHDQVLSELGSLQQSIGQPPDATRLEASLAKLITTLRATINGLRPTAVDYGLQLALFDLVDRSSSERTSPLIQLDLSESPVIPVTIPNVDLHVYRIVQQALANAIAYADAKQIRIFGTVQPQLIELHVEDDGRGFAIGPDPDISKLVAHEHFGLANMYERAHLIKARLAITSTPGQGTQVSLIWKGSSDST